MSITRQSEAQAKFAKEKVNSVKFEPDTDRVLMGTNNYKIEWYDKYTLIFHKRFLSGLRGLGEDCAMYDEKGNLLNINVGKPGASFRVQDAEGSFKPDGVVINNRFVESKVLANDKQYFAEGQRAWKFYAKLEQDLKSLANNPEVSEAVKEMHEHVADWVRRARGPGIHD